MVETVGDRIEGFHSLLVAAPAIGGSREACSTLLSTAGAPEGVLFVTFTRSAAECLTQWEETGLTGARIGVIAVGDSGMAVDRADVETWSVSSPTDLTGLGIQIAEVLGEWPDPVTVCFDSLTALLQYVEFETVYEFLHTVTGQVFAADARAHFHIDPEAHDEQTLAAVTSLVDGRVALEQDEWQVQTRGPVPKR